MSGLNLVGALQGYQQGVAWNDQQKQQAVQNKQLQTIQQANQAGADALTAAHDADVAQQQKAWTDAGNDPSTFQPKAWQPTPQVLLAGMHARSDAIAKSGDMDLWTHNEAAAAPIRNQIRQQVISKALADYQATGDGAALAQAVYPTVHDGVDITGITSGVDASQTGQTAANNGQPPAKVYNISTSDGQTHTLTGDQIASMAHDVMMNPADAAKYEYESRLLAMKSAQEAKAKQQEAQAKGEQDRQTEDVKGKYHLQGIGLEGENRLKVGEGNNKATIAAAGLRADATKYASDNRYDATSLRVGAGPDGAKKVQKTITDSDGYVVNVFKDGSMARATVDGAPVRSQDYAKRVDGLVRAARQDPRNMSKSDSDLRAAATQALSGAPAPAPAASGLVAKPASGASAAVPSVSNW
jgi:hypothetical protein